MCHRVFLVILILLNGLCGYTHATEVQSGTRWPLLDGHESVAEYAERVHLPPTQTIYLDNAIHLEVVLIPAGKFIMGTPEPTPLDENYFHKKIVTAQALLSACAGTLMVLVAVVIIQAVRQKRRPQLSLRRQLLVTVMASGCVLSSLHWRHSVQALVEVKLESVAAMTRYYDALSCEKPAHPVRLTHPYYMGKYVVTQEQYQQVTGANPSYFKGKDFAVETVSWDDT